MKLNDYQIKKEIINNIKHNEIFAQYIIDAANFCDCKDIKLLKDNDILSCEDVKNVKFYLKEHKGKSLKNINNDECEYKKYYEKIGNYYFGFGFYRNDEDDVKTHFEKAKSKILNSYFYNYESFEKNYYYVSMLMKYYSGENFIYSFVLFDLLNGSNNNKKALNFINKFNEYMTNYYKQEKENKKYFEEFLKLFVKIQLGLKYSKNICENGKLIFSKRYTILFNEDNDTFEKIKKAFYKQLYFDIFNTYVDTDINEIIKNEINSRITVAITCSQFGNYKKHNQDSAKIILRIIEIISIEKNRESDKDDWKKKLLSLIGIDVEHILPYSDSDKTIEEIKHLGFEDSLDYEQHVYKLGNLTLFESKKNQENKDVPFNFKNAKTKDAEKLKEKYNSDNDKGKRIKHLHTYDESESIMTKSIA